MDHIQTEQKTEKILSRNLSLTQKSAPFQGKKKKKEQTLTFYWLETKSCKAITFCIYFREKSQQSKMQEQNEDYQ